MLASTLPRCGWPDWARSMAPPPGMVRSTPAARGRSDFWAFSPASKEAEARLPLMNSRRSMELLVGCLPVLGRATRAVRFGRTFARDCAELASYNLPRHVVQLC